MESVQHESVERFPGAAGRTTGVVSLAVGALLLAAGVWEPSARFAPWVLAAIVVAMTLAWAANLRPALWVEDGDVLVLRGMFDTVRVPLAGIEELHVRQVLAVRAGGRRVVSAAVGRSRRTITRTAPTVPGERLDHSSPDRIDYPVYVESRLWELAADARRRAGLTHHSEEQYALGALVERRWDPLPLAVVGVAVLGLVLALLLG